MPLSSHGIQFYENDFFPTEHGLASRHVILGPGNASSCTITLVKHFEVNKFGDGQSLLRSG